MKLVADTNRIIAALIKDSVSRSILLSKKFGFCTISFSQTEIKKHEKTILQKAGIKKTDYLELFERLFSRVALFDETELKAENMHAAFEIMKKIDPTDAPFLALAIQENCGIWSEDNHFQQQQKAKVYKTPQLARLV
jgi:predicted nucleic acid-binding protein